MSELGGDHLYVGRFRQKARSGFETHFIQKNEKNSGLIVGSWRVLEVFCELGRSQPDGAQSRSSLPGTCPCWLPRRETAFKHQEVRLFQDLSCSSALDEIQFISGFSARIQIMVPSPAKVQERGAVRTASPPHRTDAKFLGAGSGGLVWIGLG